VANVDSLQLSSHMRLSDGLRALPVFALACSAPASPPPAHAEAAPVSVPEPAPTQAPEPAPTTTETPDACTGQATQELATELRQRGEASRSCYEQALRENKSLTGRMLVEATYMADGTSRDVKLVSDEVGYPTMAGCVLGLFDAPVQSAPMGDCVVIRIPLYFKPKPPEDETLQP